MTTAMTTTSLNDIGEAIRNARQVKSLSQDRLAELSGVSRSTISLLELGKRRDISWNKLTSILAALGIGVVEIGSAALRIGFRTDEHGQLLYPIDLHGVNTRYAVCKPELGDA